MLKFTKSLTEVLLIKQSHKELEYLRQDDQPNTHLMGFLHYRCLDSVTVLKAVYQPTRLADVHLTVWRRKFLHTEWLNSSPSINGDFVILEDENDINTRWKVHHSELVIPLYAYTCQQNAWRDPLRGIQNLMTLRIKEVLIALPWRDFFAIYVIRLSFSVKRI